MSYFKLIPSKSAKAYKNLTKNLNISDQFKKINDLYLHFLTFYDKKYKFVKEYGFENLKDEQKFKGLEKLDKSIKTALSVLKFCYLNTIVQKLVEDVSICIKRNFAICVTITYKIIIYIFGNLKEIKLLNTFMTNQSDSKFVTIIMKLLMVNLLLRLKLRQFRWYSRRTRKI